MKKNKSKDSSFIVVKIVIIVFAIIFALFIAADIFVYVKTGSGFVSNISYAKKIVDNSKAIDFRENTQSVFYDSDNNVITASRSDSVSTYINYDQISPYVIDGFVDVEDSTFWINNGFSYIGLGRAFLSYIGLSDANSGGSTITQQVAKNTYLNQDVTIDRKIKEICIAALLSEKYSKKQILEFYCNQVNFSNGIYGIEDASQRYFGIPAKDLSISQAAYLCAIPNRPTYYNPLENPQNAISRRDYILKAMYQHHDISAEEYAEALNEKISINRTRDRAQSYQRTFANECAVEYFMEANNISREEAEQMVNTGGYEIHTSLDTQIQEKLQNSIDTNLATSQQKKVSNDIYEFQGAATVIDNNTNKVVAIVGGRSQIATSESYSLNRAYQSYRQPGSSIKPLVVYTPAFMKGLNPEQYRNAVANSTNDVASNVFAQITPEYGMSFLQDMGFARIVEDDIRMPSALGGLTHGVTTVEMAGAYNALANEGVYTKPTCITSIKDADGRELYKAPETKQIYSKEAANAMTDLMTDVIKSGTASSMKWYEVSDKWAAGKTGTTNDNKDGWFCGITKDYTMCVWVGCDRPESIKDLQGNTYPLSIWKEVMLQVSK